jgi:hypothetical protein
MEGASCDEYWDLLSTHGTCNRRGGSPARACALRSPDADVFRRFTSYLHATGNDTRECRSPTDITDSSWGGEPWRIWPDITRELRLSEPRVPDQLGRHKCSQSAHLFPDDWPLQMQFCEWLWHQLTPNEFPYITFCGQTKHVLGFEPCGFLDI